MQGAFFVGYIMCIYAREIIERLTAGSCRYMTYCELYKRYCLGTKDCKTYIDERKKKCQQSKQL